MQLRGRAIGGTEFPSIPEVLENIFSYLDSKTLLNCRKVCKVWNDEACMTLGRLRSTDDMAVVDINWGRVNVSSAPSYIFNHRLRTLLTNSLNRHLFSGCFLETSSQFQWAKELFVDFGSVLRIVRLDLGQDFPLEFHVRHLDALYKLVTDWGQNIQFFELSLGVENLKRMRKTLIKEGYSPKFSLKKKTNIKELDLLGIITPCFPLFAVDLIKSSPKLGGLNIEELPLYECRLKSLGPEVIRLNPTAFLEILTELPQITSQLKQFGYSFAEKIHQDLIFQPMCDENAAITATAFGNITFGSLKKLSVDSCMLGGETTGSAKTFNQVLKKNPKLETIAIECSAQGTALSVVEEDNIILNPVILDVSLPLLTRLCLNTIKTKNVDLFSSLCNFPNLSSLEVRKRDPNSYLYDQAFSCFFKAEHSLTDSPHLCLKKLVYDYPFECFDDFGAVLDSFPNLEVLDTPLYFGWHFLFGPDEIEEVGPYMNEEKMSLAFYCFAEQLKQLKQLRVQSHQELHTVEDWASAFRALRKLKGLGELIIDCRSLRQPSEYLDKLKKLVSKLSKARTDAVPVTIFPNNVEAQLLLARTVC